jgi:hypothetical protein
VADYTVGAVELGLVRTSDFGEFVSIAKGRSIVSVADWGVDRFELGLSGGLMIRFFTSAPTEVNVIPTVNPGELPPLIVALGDLPQSVPLSVIEDKLRGLRTLHAIYYLVETGRSADLARYLESTPAGDIERDLLDEDDRLRVESISYGSWVLALWAKSAEAYRAVSSVAGLVFERGREAYLRRLEAEAHLRENQAEREGVQLARDEFDLRKSQMDYLLDISDRIDAPEIKERLKQRVLESVDALAMGDTNEKDARKRLTDRK